MSTRRDNRDTDTDTDTDNGSAAATGLNATAAPAVIAATNSFFMPSSQFK